GCYGGRPKGGKKKKGGKKILARLRAARARLRRIFLLVKRMAGSNTQGKLGGSGGLRVAVGRLRSHAPLHPAIGCNPLGTFLLAPFITSSKTAPESSPGADSWPRRLQATRWKATCTASSRPT